MLLLTCHLDIFALLVLFTLSLTKPAATLTANWSTNTWLRNPYWTTTLSAPLEKPDCLLCDVLYVGESSGIWKCEKLNEWILIGMKCTTCSWSEVNLSSSWQNGLKSRFSWEKLTICFSLLDYSHKQTILRKISLSNKCNFSWPYFGT